MIEKNKIIITPGPSKIYSLNLKPLEKSDISFDRMVQLYKTFFLKKGNPLEDNIAYKPTLTQKRFISNIEINIPKELNSGQELKLIMVLNIIVNQKYIISYCEMKMDNEYLNSNKKYLINYLNGLNTEFNELGVRYYINNDKLENSLGWEQVWENVLDNTALEMYYSQIINNLNQFGHNFDFLEKYLDKLKLDNGQVVFPYFL